jgi:ABC-type multidrug transport system ATPase subunit
MNTSSSEKLPSFADHLRQLARGEPAFPEIDHHPVRVIPLGRSNLTFGSGTDSEVVLPDESVAPAHAMLEFDGGIYFLRDLRSGAATFVNGKAITRESLSPGDLIYIGAYLFCFKSNHLAWIRQPGAPTLAALNLSQKAGEAVLLDDVTLVVQPGEFVGILGPSGAGKTTLLDALYGFRPAQSGRVFLDGDPLYEEYDRLAHQMGYVPQAELVHPELTPTQALEFVFKLRRPSATPEERSRTIAETLAVLDLEDRAELPIAKLSGGQRKRVAVGVELLCKPGVMFLDEPTAGLDPGAEAKLMRKLKQLAELGKSIICTTHIMDNVELFDKIAIIAAGGKLVFFGTPVEARRFFQVARPVEIYDRLEERTAHDWQQLYRKHDAFKAMQVQASKERKPRPVGRQLQSEPPSPPGFFEQCATLTHRFARILASDAQNLGLALLQAVLMSNIICLVMNDMPAISFMLVISALWFGCSGAAQQLVRERSIYRRERMVNLRLDAYVFSKFGLLALIGTVQCALMLGIVRFWNPDVVWSVMLPAMILASCNGIAMGLIISALASTADKATAIVPLVLLPQIIFAGVLTPIGDMGPATNALSYAMVARWANQAMEVSLCEGKTVDAELLKNEAYLRPLWNLNTEYNLWKDDGRQRFLQERGNTIIERRRWLAADFGVLAGFVVAQLLASAILLRRQDVF